MKNHMFTITIGDNNNQGHCETSEHIIRSSHSIDDVRSAYFEAERRCGKAWPEILFQKAGMNYVADEDHEEIKNTIGFDFDSMSLMSRKFLSTDDVINFIFHFIIFGNPDIQLEEIEMDSFNYGKSANTNRSRIISNIGYGVVGF